MSTDLLEPVPITVTRFVCPFCHRSRSRRGPAKLHMTRCWKNPELKGCKTCVFFQDNKCEAGFNIQPGLVTECTKWKEITN